MGIVKCVKLPYLGTDDDCWFSLVLSPVSAFGHPPYLSLLLQITKPTSSSGTLPRPPLPSWPPASRPSACCSAKRPPTGPPTSATPPFRVSPSPSALLIAVAACLAPPRTSKSSASIASRRATTSQEAVQAGTGVRLGAGAGVEAGVGDLRLRRRPHSRPPRRRREGPEDRGKRAMNGMIPECFYFPPIISCSLSHLGSLLGRFSGAPQRMIGKIAKDGWTIGSTL